MPVSHMIEIELLSYLGKRDCKWETTDVKMTKKQNDFEEFIDVWFYSSNK